MFPDDDPRTAGLRMLRSGADATREALAGGASLRQVRGELLAVGLVALTPDEGDPALYASFRSALVGTVERTYFEHHWQPVGA